MNKYKKLLKTSAIFAAANLGCHLISFLLVRFYTELLSTDQYGIVDFLTITASLVVPIFTLGIVEAVLRYSIDKTDLDDILSTGIGVSIIGTLLFSIVSIFFFLKSQYAGYYVYLICYVLVSSLNNICMQYARGTGKSVSFAVSGIIKSTVLATSNIVLLLGLGWKVEGYLLSLILSEFSSLCFVIITCKLWRRFRFHVRLPLIKKMLVYSIPLIPSTLSWWTMNAADKYVIFAVLGPASAGIYAVAHKLPTLIDLCNKIFFQAWQLSAVEEASNENKDQFYSEVFNALSMFLTFAASLLLLFLRPIMHFLSSDAFSNAWKYSPFLVLSLVFSAFASFLGTNYFAMKKTKGEVKTTLLGVGVNLVLNFVLIYPLGMTGTAIATMLGFAATWLYRAYDTRAFVSIRYRPFALLAIFSSLILQASLLVMESNAAVFAGIFTCTLIYFIYQKETHRMLRSLIGMFKTKFCKQ